MNELFKIPKWQEYGYYSEEASRHYNHPMRSANIRINAIMIPRTTDSRVILRKFLKAFDIFAP